MAGQALFIRLDQALHDAIEAAAKAQNISAAGWARRQLALAVGTPAPSRRSPLRPKVRAVPVDQRDLRAVVATLGGLGAAVRDAGVSAELLTEIQTAVRVAVARISAP